MQERIVIAVTFSPERGGFVGTAPELGAAQPIVTLSLGGMRRKVEALLLPDKPIVVLNLDKAARRERDQRRHGGQPGAWPR